MLRYPSVAVPILVAAMLTLTAGSARATPPASCPGQAITPTRVITGSFGQAQKNAYILIPFRVPRGTTQVRVQYCYDKPESGSSSHTLDLGIYDGLRRGDRLWGGREFRGWGGSSHPDVALSRGGFSSAAEYLAQPKGYVPGRTTRGFEPGRIRPGRWAVELGVGAVIPKEAGDATGEVGWRVAIELSRDPAFSSDPYHPAPYNPGPVRSGAGWYQGDFHVHDEHSNLGAATIAETLGYAFRPRAEGGAGLDFTALSDYVTDSGWGEIGRYQSTYPNNLVFPSAEVITYHGHLANQAAGGWVDYRTGPVLVRRADGSLVLRRGPTPPRAVFGQIHRLGGFTVVNHPRIFPPTTPGLEAFCRGCYWNYSDADTGFDRLDALEIMNVAQAFDAAKTVENPFTGPALDYWQHILAGGFHVAALGGSDTHNAGRTNGPTDAPVGTPATNVFADELSEKGIQRGVQAGHTFVKAFGSGGPDLRLTARPVGSSEPPAIMGDSVSGAQVRLEASVLGATDGVARQLEIQKDGVSVMSAPVAGPRTDVALTVHGPGRYGLVLMRGASVIEAVGSPVYVNEPRTPLRVRLVGGRRLRVHHGRVVVLCRGGGTDARSCRARLSVGRAPVQEWLTGGRSRLVLPVPRLFRRRTAFLRLTVTDRLGATAKVRLPVSVGP